MAKRKNSRRKGNKGENDFAKDFGTWWCGDSKAFRRTPLSGGWLGKDTDGDIIAVTDESKLCPFLFEVKRREGWKLDELLFPIKSEGNSIFAWWKRTCLVATAKKEVPLLIFRRNRSKWILMLQADYVTRLKADNVIASLEDVRCIRAHIPEVGDVFLIPWEDWKEKVDPKKLMLLSTDTENNVNKNRTSETIRR